MAGLCATLRAVRDRHRPPTAPERGDKRCPPSAQQPERHQATLDTDAQETREWLEALDAVISAEGPERAHFLLEKLIEEARHNGIDRPFSATTPYINTIEPVDEERSPGNLELEGRLRAYMRWNAMAMVVKANRHDPADGGDLGGHISSASSRWRTCSRPASTISGMPTTPTRAAATAVTCSTSRAIPRPASMPAPSWKAGISEEQLLNFRQEVDGKGLSSYPHPKLMPEFWQFPTVSMGLGPIMAIYQARFLKYLHARGIADTAKRKVWVFCGDGEMDEPESLGAIGLAAREKLDNLVFVVNCNLQRLDGPVRGNGKIIQELEGEFRGSGWNVIKLLWGKQWDELLARDKDGALRKIMLDTLDGDYQAFKANDGAFVRKHFFGRDPRTLEMVAKMSDERGLEPAPRRPRCQQGVRRLPCRQQQHPGPAHGAAGQDGQGLRHGPRRRGQEHRAPDQEADRRRHPLLPRPLQHPHPRQRAAEDPVLQAGRRHAGDEVPARAPPEALGGYLPHRRAKADESFTVPSLETFKAVLDATPDGREISTTQAYVRFLTQLLRDKALGPRVVPILVDEARTFGMEGLFRQIGIYNPLGQNYTPVDKDQVMYYREATDGQILQEGINEAGGMCSWIAAATSYSTNNRIMVPFYVYYSMFGFQRIGDLAWAAGDMQARGFLLGGTSGRTTLNGEGLQHEDGHSHILAGTIPNCISYDPTLCARGGRDHPPRPEAHGGEAGERLLLPDPAQRELPRCRA